jgi:hypothetical protein
MNNTPQSTADQFISSKHGNEQMFSRDAVAKLLCDFADAKFEAFKQKKELWLTGVNYEQKRNRTNGVY